MALSMKHISSLKNISFIRQNQTCLVAVRHKYFRKGFNPESEVLKEYENQILGVKGKVYEKKPAKVELKPGKNYHWCSCGYGHTQPLCDGTHKTLADRNWTKVKFKPLVFRVEEEKTYFLCNCKHTKNPPYCDGTHRELEEQDKWKGKKE